MTSSCAAGVGYVSPGGKTRACSEGWIHGTQSATSCPAAARCDARSRAFTAVPVFHGSAAVVTI
eukprot:scaffold41425_cov191-Isochrysis_galbana.AAC.1